MDDRALLIKNRKSITVTFFDPSLIFEGKARSLPPDGIMSLNIMTFSIMTFTITTLSMKKFSITTLNIMTFTITTLSIMKFSITITKMHATLSIKTLN